ncbi:uncharacterized protein LOC110411098 isoform X1 [Herrania umbratica]|uniref:Uncharacterized protein LOC110411098 isoform X1 n=2 Tax=Herrania umbratica TaxID=108875 RepID=A0A6J0ZRA9_9ROSI|nr:uncharacterized protein LOC110411098 isoform X1 [Herrania umbratica]
MKRKDIDDDFSFLPRSTKSRRLGGGDLLSIMEEDPSTRVPLRLEHQERPLATTTNNTQSNASFVDTMPSSQVNAILLYNSSNTPFLKSPTSTDFSIVIDSALYPGLKDRLLYPGDSWAVKSMEDKAMDNGSSSGPNDRLAVVPWVAPQLALASGTETEITAPLQPTEAEDTDSEMMDAEESGVSNFAGKGFRDGEMVEGTEAFQLRQQQQQQQQHCLMPQFPQNMNTPVTW